MKTRAITCTPDEVRGLLAGTLTVLTRPVTPAPEFAQVYTWRGRVVYDASHRSWCWGGKAHGRYPDEYLSSLAAVNPLGLAPERLWVRETWAQNQIQMSDTHMDRSLVYRADGEERAEDNGVPRPWIPPVRMPRHVSRITLEIDKSWVDTTETPEGPWTWTWGVSVWKVKP